MELAEHCVALPPPDELVRVRADSCREERHRPSRSEGACANILRGEADGPAGRADHGPDGCRDTVAADGDSLVLVAYRRKRSCAGGAVASKVCDAATQRYHWTALGIACSAVADRFSLDTIFWCGE